MKRIEKSASKILGNSDYLAISYGGYRQTSRDIQPTMEELKEDLRILHAMGIRLLRTYNTHYAQASNLVKAIAELKQMDKNFEMYVMLGAWMDCENAWTDHPNHFGEDTAANEAEIERAVKLTQQYPDIIKIIAVGNEAMVKWAASYFVQADVILKWVNYLQDLKQKKELPSDLWITSSDNFASWGGGGTEYHTPALQELAQSVDFISLHTYPMHDTHYNPAFWGVPYDSISEDKETQIKHAMQGALEYAQKQYQSVQHYMDSIGVKKALHIGETGWASSSNGFYGGGGSKATDEYKEALYYDLIRKWTNDNGISCFYFEAFDEPWKDAGNPGGSENYFGLISVDGKAKYALWEMVDSGVFDGLKRGGNPIMKTHDGNKEDLLETVDVPPFKANY